MTISFISPTDPTAPVRLDASDFIGTCTHVDNYEKLNRIGEGTYGVVYRARDKRTSRIVALKKLRLDVETVTNDTAERRKNDPETEVVPSDGLPISHFREIMLLMTLKHENIVNVEEVVVSNRIDTIFTVMPYCEQDLGALLDSMSTPFSPSEVKCLMFQLFQGVKYLHDSCVIHRNLLLTADGTLKIADFGLARRFSFPPNEGRARPLTPKVVTLWYRAPEVLLGDRHYTIAIDMWSLGCIFGELLKHSPLLPGHSDTEQLEMIASLLGAPTTAIWPDMSSLPSYSPSLFPSHYKYNNLTIKFPHATTGTIALLNGLLTYNPRRRWSIRECLRSEYFEEDPKMKDKRLLPVFPEYRNAKSMSNEPVKRNISGYELIPPSDAELSHQLKRLKK